MTDTVTSWNTTSELYRSSYRTMLRVAYSITGDHGAAEDAVHDAFCAVGPRVGSLDDPLPYLRVAVVNRCRALHRSSKREQRHHDGRVSSAATDLTADVDPGSDLFEFGDALERLSFAQRSAIVLRYLCDLPDEEIADVLNCRRSTVRSHLRRGLDALRKEFS